MKYSKPPLNFTQQAELLIGRGLIVENKQEFIDYLSRVNYYRLSGYWYVFKQIDSETHEERFLPGTTFNQIRQQYEFDRRLRLLMLGAIERIEVAIFRTRMVEAFTLRFGAFGYCDYANYNPRYLPEEKFKELMKEIQGDQDRSKEEFITRYHKKYDEESDLPMWMVTELMSYGSLLTIYRNMPTDIKNTISRGFNLHATVLDSWLLCLNTVRNACAHHTRIWNRPLAIIPKIPYEANDPRWHRPIAIPDDKIFTILTIAQYLLAYLAPEDHWKTQLLGLLAEFPSVPLKPIGFPENWDESTLWIS